MFEEFYNALYFDWIVEIERMQGKVTRFVEIMEGLTRHGIHMSET